MAGGGKDLGISRQEEKEGRSPSDLGNFRDAYELTQLITNQFA